MRGRLRRWATPPRSMIGGPSTGCARGEKPEEGSRLLPPSDVRRRALRAYRSTEPRDRQDDEVLPLPRVAGAAIGVGSLIGFGIGPGVGEEEIVVRAAVERIAGEGNLRRRVDERKVLGEPHAIRVDEPDRRTVRPATGRMLCLTEMPPFPSTAPTLLFSINNPTSVQPDGGLHALDADLRPER